MNRDAPSEKKKKPLLTKKAFRVYLFLTTYMNTSDSFYKKEFETLNVKAKKREVSRLPQFF